MVHLPAGIYRLQKYSTKAFYSLSLLCIVHECILSHTWAHPTTTTSASTLQVPYFSDSSLDTSSGTQVSTSKTDDNSLQVDPEGKIIRTISIQGGSPVPESALRSKIPYKVGEPFEAAKTGQLIRNITSFGYFTNAKVKVKDIDNTNIDLFVIIQQDKKKVEGWRYQGAKAVKTDEFAKRFKLEEVKNITQEEAQVYAQELKKFYAEKGYHSADITCTLEPITQTTQDNQQAAQAIQVTQNTTTNTTNTNINSNNVTVVYTIQEGARALVKQVCFEGNKAFASKKLKSLLLTREDWFLSFMDKSGTYLPQILERDKYVLEDLYQSNGFLTMRVLDVRVETDPQTHFIKITFVIEEGDIYTVKSVSVPGNDILKEQQLLCMIPIRPGQLYSRELLRQSLEQLRLAWGEFGYIYADINQVIQPNFEDKTVDITLISDLSNKMFLNRLTIFGNFKTRDYVVRRAITLTEGELLTTQQLDFSKDQVMSLGFFSPHDGVDWRINRISDNLVDLDLMLREIKTGNLYGQIGYGGGADIKSPSTGFKVGAGVSDRNLFGTGILTNLSLNFAREDRSVVFNMYQPWLFDRPIGVGFDVFHRRTVYEDIKTLSSAPVEHVTGGLARLTFAPDIFPRTTLSANIGAENINYKKDHRVHNLFEPDYQSTEGNHFLYQRRFTSGKLHWLGVEASQDLRNHPIAPNRGTVWNAVSKLAMPFKSCFGFFKADLDATWITPLINEYDLLLILHGHVGYIKPINNKLVPYRELYHVGGPGTVRGFTFGQIGPQITGDSIGASKAFWVNAELVFSITKDQSFRGVLFYDGGAAWDTPLCKQDAKLAIVNNRFNYRHAIGFGIRLTAPVPLRVDWGFKLDRNKRLKESAYEIHFSMSQDF